MDYESFINSSLTKTLRTQNYKKHIIDNIEIIGQRKLVILDDGGDVVNVKVLEKVLNQLRKKGVKVPELAFMASNDERDIKDNNFLRSITELKGMSKAYYVLITSAYGEMEEELKGLSGHVGDAKSIEQRLMQYGFTERDYCIMNKPCGLFGPYMNFKKKLFEMGKKSSAKKLDALAKKTELQLKGFENKFRGQRCFILGCGSDVRVDELNIMLPEKCIAYNAFCKYFTRTPQRPSQYILTDPLAYLGNGKYIESMECFISSSVKIFEDKFNKKPTYINMMGVGIIPQLPPFADTQAKESVRRIAELYVAIELAMYEGFTEIYLYGFDGIYDADFTPYGEALLNESGKYDYPEDAKTLLKNIKTYASSAGVSIYAISDISGFDMFEKKPMSEIDFSTANTISRI